MIVEKLLDQVKDELVKREAIDVRIGLSYTGVLLDNQKLGIAYSFREEANHCCEVVESAGELERNAFELAKMANKYRAIDSSVGIATINAAINQNISGKKGGLLNFLEIEQKDKVGMVGRFDPLIDRFPGDIELNIFERNPQEEDVYPDWAAEKILPNMDICIITGTSVVNKTIDRLLELCSGAREVAILGPTTPLSKKVFGEHGATFLGGMVFEDVRKALKIISQGGGTRKFRDVARKVSVEIPDNDEYIY